MAVQQKQVDYIKELDDVFALLVSIISDAKAKKSIAEIASGSVAKLVDAVSGADQIPAELKASKKVVMDTALLRISEIVEVLA